MRHARPDRGEIDVDFVVHGDDGPASRWVRRAEIGDEMECHDDVPEALSVEETRARIREIRAAREVPQQYDAEAIEIATTGIPVRVYPPAVAAD